MTKEVQNEPCSHAADGAVWFNPETNSFECSHCGEGFLPEGAVNVLLASQEQMFARVSAMVMREVVEQGEDALEPKPEKTGLSAECKGNPTGRHFVPLGSSECADCGESA